MIDAARSWWRAKCGPPDFLWLWASDSVSVFGSEITLLALPLTAVLLLHASPQEMGVLVAMELLPYGLFSLHAGAWVDRWRKLPILQFAALSRSVLLLTIPLCAAVGVLRLELLCIVAFALSTHAVFVDIAYQALLPRLVARDELVRANARFGLTESAAGIVGPGAAGLLLQWLTAPMVIVADAFAMFGAGMLLRRLRFDEPRPPQPLATTTLRQEIVQGLRVVAADPILRWSAVMIAAWQFLKHMFLTIFMLFAVHDAGLSASGVGFVSSMIGLGFLLSSLSVKRLSDRIGLGATMLVGLALATLCWGLSALVRGPGPLAMAELAVAMAGEGLGTGLLCLSFVSLRQVIAPADCLGRVIASFRFLTLTTAPLGALLGGMLGELIGLRQTLALTSLAGLLVVGVASLYSPMLGFRPRPPAIQQ